MQAYSFTDRKNL